MRSYHRQGSHKPELYVTPPAPPPRDDVTHRQSQLKQNNDLPPLRSKYDSGLAAAAEEGQHHKEDAVVHTKTDPNAHGPNLFHRMAQQAARPAKNEAHHTRTTIVPTVRRMPWSVVRNAIVDVHVEEPQLEDLPPDEGLGQTTEEDNIIERSRSQKPNLRVVMSSKAFHRAPMKIQVRLARLLERFNFTDDECLFTAMNKDAVDSIFFIQHGEVDVMLDRGDATALPVGRLGPGSMLGGLRSLGMVSYNWTHARRVVHSSNKASADELEIWHLPRSKLYNRAEISNEDFAAIRLFILRETKKMALSFFPRIADMAFFRGCSPPFINSMVPFMDLRVCKPNQLVFKQKRKRNSLAILLCGQVNVWKHAIKINTIDQPGACFGENALFGFTAQSVTVRCGSTECLIWLMDRRRLLDICELYPSQLSYLERRQSTKLVRIAMATVFKSCSYPFIELLTLTGKIIHFKWGQKLAQEDSGERECLHLCCEGKLYISRKDDVIGSLRKGDGIGFEAILGLTHAPQDYSIIGANGCGYVLRLTFEEVKRAVTFFPSQILPLLAITSLKTIPAEHPFAGLDNIVWEKVLGLMQRTLMTTDIDIEWLKAIGPCFKVEVCPEGMILTQEGEDCDQMSLVIDGSLRWTRDGVLSDVFSGPIALDAGAFLGNYETHRATVTTETVCIVWHLMTPGRLRISSKSALVPTEALDRMTALTEQAHGWSENFQNRIRARLRNMRTFRHFDSTALEMMSLSMELQVFLPSEYIIQENDQGDCMYVILQGQAEAITDGKVTLVENCTLGESSLFGRAKKRAMTVRAATICACYVASSTVINAACMMSAENGDSRRSVKVMEARSRKDTVASLASIFGEPADRDGIEHTDAAGRLRKRATEKLRTEPRSNSLPNSTIEDLVLDSFKEKKENESNLDKRFGCNTPRLPAVVPSLYQTPVSAEASMSMAFRSVLPAAAQTAASQMHGVGNKGGLLLNVPSEELLNSRVSLNSARSARSWAPGQPTYTKPLGGRGPIAGVLAAHRSFVKPKEAERSAGVAGHLQVLASCLLRINAKTRLGLLRNDSVEAIETAEGGAKASQHVDSKASLATAAGGASVASSQAAGRALRLRRLYEQTELPLGGAALRARQQNYEKNQFRLDVHESNGDDDGQRAVLQTGNGESLEGEVATTEDTEPRSRVHFVAQPSAASGAKTPALDSECDDSDGGDSIASVGSDRPCTVIGHSMIFRSNTMTDLNDTSDPQRQTSAKSLDGDASNNAIQVGHSMPSHAEHEECGSAPLQRGKLFDRRAEMEARMWLRRAALGGAAVRLSRLASAAVDSGTASDAAAVGTAPDASVIGNPPDSQDEGVQGVASASARDAVESQDDGVGAVDFTLCTQEPPDNGATGAARAAEEPPNDDAAAVGFAVGSSVAGKQPEDEALDVNSMGVRAAEDLASRAAEEPPDDDEGALGVGSVAACAAERPPTGDAATAGLKICSSATGEPPDDEAIGVGSVAALEEPPVDDGFAVGASAIGEQPDEGAICVGSVAARATEESPDDKTTPVDVAVGAFAAREQPDEGAIVVGSVADHSARGPSDHGETAAGMTAAASAEAAVTTASVAAFVEEVIAAVLARRAAAAG